MTLRILCPLLVTAVMLTAAPSAHATDSDGDSVTDESDALPCDPTASSVVYVPAKGEHGMLLFEDLWPANGDLDFNDQVIAYNYVLLQDYVGKVSALQLTVNVLAAGTGAPSSLWLHLPVAPGSTRSITINYDDGVSIPVEAAGGEDEVVFQILADTRSVFTGFTGSNHINSHPELPALTGKPLNVLVRFASPVSLDVSQAPFDLFIVRRDDTRPDKHEIHQPQYPGTRRMDVSLFGTADDGSTADRHFVNTNGLPFALNVPELVAWPKEFTRIESLYPDIVGFASSGGTTNTDFYDSTVDLTNAWVGGANNTDPPVPTMAGPVFPYIDQSCVGGWQGVVQFGGASELWVRGSTTHPSGDVFVTGEILSENGKHWDAFLARFTGAGQQVWLKTFGDTKKNDYARSAAADAAGNAYVVGVTGGTFGGQSSKGSSDAFLAKFDPAGNLLWVRQFGSSQYDEAFAVIADAIGNSAVAGYTNGDSLGMANNPKKAAQAFIVTFGANGQQASAKQHDFGGQYAIAAGIAPAGQGKYLLSVLRHDGDIYNGGAAKVGANGELEWQTGGKKGNGDTMKWAQGVASDANGNAYVTGYVQRAPACHAVQTTVCYSKGRCYTVNNTRCDNVFDAFVEKTSANGLAVWEQRMTPTPAPGLPYAYAIGQAVVADGAGGVYVAGGVWGALPTQSLKGGYDYFLARWNGNGVLQWVRQNGGANYDYGTSVCVDGQGSPILSGYTNSNLGGMGAGHGFVSRFTPLGVQQ